MIITAGKFKGRKIIAPDANITRPTLSKVRMSIFNTLQSLIEFRGSSFLDMYAGSGVMGLEALSRGFSNVVAIEKNHKAYNIIKKNYMSLQGKHKSDIAISLFKNIAIATVAPLPRNDIGLYIGDSLKIAPKLEKFDVIYIDPPYFSGVYEQSLVAIKNIASNIVILEHVTDIDFSGFEVIKQKKYGDKIITFLTKENI